MSFDIHEHLVDWWQLCIDSIIFIFAIPEIIFDQTKETNLTTVRSEATSDTTEGIVGDGEEFPRTCTFDF